MNEMDVLKNRWREAKGTRTFPDIAEAADLSPSTVSPRAAARKRSLPGRTPPTGSRGTNPPSGISNISAPSF